MKKFDIKKILVPTDFSETANKAINQAIAIAVTTNAKLKLIHVIKPNDIMPAGFIKTWDDSIYKKAKKELKKIVKNIKKNNSITVSIDVKIGSIDEEICAMARKEKMDLIVIGTHGTSGVKEFFVGSNAYKIVSKALCPVLTIQKKPIDLTFKNIILPIRLERNSRQKVDYVVELAHLFNSTVFITGFTNDKNKSKQDKVKQYVAQVEKYLTKNNINHKSQSIFADNFTKEILVHATNNKADLIVVMKENDFSVDQLIKGPFAQQFVNHSSIPVLSIPVFSDPDMMVYSPFLSGSAPY